MVTRTVLFVFSALGDQNYVLDRNATIVQIGYDGGPFSVSGDPGMTWAGVIAASNVNTRAYGIGGFSGNGFSMPARIPLKKDSRIYVNASAAGVVTVILESAS